MPKDTKQPKRYRQTLPDVWFIHLNTPKGDDYSAYATEDAAMIALDDYVQRKWENFFTSDDPNNYTMEQRIEKYFEVAFEADYTRHERYEMRCLQIEL